MTGLRSRTPPLCDGGQRVTFFVLEVRHRKRLPDNDGRNAAAAGVGCRHSPASIPPDSQSGSTGDFINSGDFELQRRGGTVSHGRSDDEQRTSPRLCGERQQHLNERHASLALKTQCLCSLGGDGRLTASAPIPTEI